jgi:glycosyltransferase involved in cell wall biosynthesis
MRALFAFLAQFRADVIHAHMFHSLLVALLAKALLKAKPAICFTSHLNPYPPARAAVVRGSRRWRDVDIVFVKGQHQAINAAHTLVIPNGVPFGPMPERAPWQQGGRLRLLAVGRLADQKDPLGLIEAFAAASLANATLDFVGAGPLMDEARALADRLGLASRVTFHGISRQAQRFMREADVLVMHSKYEGMPMALLEAAALAMPIISTPVGAAESVLGEGRGYIAGPATFAESIRAISADPGDAIERGKRLYEYAKQHFSLESVAARHEEAYRLAARRRY